MPLLPPVGAIGNGRALLIKFVRVAEEVEGGYGHVRSINVYTVCTGRYEEKFC